MASKRTIWHKLGKYVSGVIVACFFLPFFGVSCDGVDVITVSGADMAGGCKPGGMIAAIDEGGSEMKGGQLTTKIDSVDIEPLAIVALACVVLVFGLSWVRERRALVGACVLSVAALGALGGLYLKVTGDLSKEIARETERGKQGALGKDIKIDAGGRFGLWVSCLGLLGVAGVTALALREQEPRAAAPPAEPVG